MFIIEKHGWRCAIAPELGGALAGLSFKGREVLRAAPSGATAPFDLASFALVPYANRIADGRLRFGGIETTLPPNLSGEPHPLHGTGFLSCWTVRERLDERILLAFDQPASPAWPWPFSARQLIALDEAGLSCRLVVENSGVVPAPVGAGFHPYFPLARTARLTARLGGVWLTDGRRLPTAYRRTPLRNWAATDSVQGDTLIDHCHTGWDGTATIEWPGYDRPVVLTASPELCMLHIYAPPDEDFFCLEPVSHRPDAINAADPIAQGMAILKPGETFTAWMRIALG